MPSLAGIVVRCLRAPHDAIESRSRMIRSTVQNATSWPWRRRYQIILRRPYISSGWPTQSPQRVFDMGVGDIPCRRLPATGFSVGPRCDLHAVRRQRPADPLATVDLAILVDEGDDQRCRRSSSRAKKAGANFKISLACLKSRTSLRGLSARHARLPATCRSPGLIQPLQDHTNSLLTDLTRVTLRHDDDHLPSRQEAALNPWRFIPTTGNRMLTVRWPRPSPVAKIIPMGSFDTDGATARRVVGGPPSPLARHRKVLV